MSAISTLSFRVIQVLSVISMENSLKIVKPGKTADTQK